MDNFNRSNKRNHEDGDNFGGRRGFKEMRSVRSPEEPGVSHFSEDTIQPHPGPQAQPACASDAEKRKLVQQQLVLLLHAHQCRRKESQATGGVESCNLPHCTTMKNVLNHMPTCHLGRQCTMPHCSSSRQIISHWRNCTWNNCPVCSPLMAADRRRVEPNGANQGATGIGLENHTWLTQEDRALLEQFMMGPMSSILPTADQIASIQESAGGTLDVPVPGPSTSTASVPAINASTQRPAAMGSQVGVAASGSFESNVNNEATQQVFNRAQNLEQYASSSAINDFFGHASTSNNLNPGARLSFLLHPSQPGSLQSEQGTAPAQNQGTQEWHQSVGRDFRDRMVDKIIRAVHPAADPATYSDPTSSYQRIIKDYATKIENGMFETANTREEYYQRVAEKIYKITYGSQEDAENVVTVPRQSTLVAQPQASTSQPWASRTINRTTYTPVNFQNVSTPPDSTPPSQAPVSHSTSFDDWKNPSYRSNVVKKIEDAVRNSGMTPSHSNVQMEDRVFNKARSKEDYLSSVARLIRHIRAVGTGPLRCPYATNSTTAVTNQAQGSSVMDVLRANNNLVMSSPSTSGTQASRNAGTSTSVTIVNNDSIQRHTSALSGGTSDDSDVQIIDVRPVSKAPSENLKNNVIPDSVDPEDKLCSCCYKNPKNAAFVHGSIAHIWSCYECAIDSIKSQNLCPICRQEVDSIVKIVVC